jgi:hypothetical protein
MALGRTVLPTNTVFPTRISADGHPEYKAGGITIDWSTVTASGSDTTLPDGSVIKANLKYLRYGQTMTKITTGTGQTLTSTATAGNFTITILRPDTNQQVTTASIAFNASAATILTAVQAVLPPGEAVSSSGGPLNTTPVVVSFSTFFPLVTITNNTLTGGTLTPTVSTVGATGGYFGPYDPGASDGRQTLNIGDAIILDETVLQYPAGTPMVTAANDHYGSPVEGGMVFIDRVLNTGAGAHTLAGGPTLAEIKSTFPRLRLVKD